jgi:ATP-dependent DNA helicase RecQ
MIAHASLLEPAAETSFNPRIMPGKNPQHILKEVFGYDTFRPLQREIIDNVIAARDTLAIMPTGGGKSLCYQIPALMFEGLTVVVSPLIALMKDQVEQMQAAGVPAMFLNSTLDNETYQANMEAVKAGQVKLLYVAPESLLTPRITELLKAVRLDCLTIDEAHCISEWGHDFRPDYRQIIDVRKRHPGAVCLALTATATPRVRQDIASALEFDEQNEFVAGFNRENLFIEVRQKQPRHAFHQVADFLRERKKQSGIIYCFTRRQVEDLAEDLKMAGFSALPYHAGLEDDVRRKNQEAFIRDETQIIVATIAFGMGINKPNVRFVIHFDIPKSIESYYQEIGRAGRDGLPAHCLLLLNHGDATRIRTVLEKKEGEDRDIALKQLQNMINLADNIRDCRRKGILEHFGEAWDHLTCKNCDVCTREPVKFVDVTIPAQKFLSCVIRVDERFGAAHIIAVLRGSKSDKIKRFRHDQLSTYGIGADLPEANWQTLWRSLLTGGYLDINPEHRTLRMTPKGRDALARRLPIEGLLQAPAGTTSYRAAPASDVFEYDVELFERLRVLRKSLADASGIPPYVVFGDRTLTEMAAYLPQSTASLQAISGVGSIKLATYGDQFLKVICDYCAETGQDERPRQVAVAPPSALGVSASGRRRRLVEGFNQGETIARLASRFEIKAGTVVQHLTEHVLEGLPLQPNPDLEIPELTAEDHRAIHQAFDELGARALRPVYEHFHERISYDHLKIRRLAYLIGHKPS